MWKEEYLQCGHEVFADAKAPSYAKSNSEPWGIRLYNTVTTCPQKRKKAIPT